MALAYDYVSKLHFYRAKSFRGGLDGDTPALVNNKHCIILWLPITVAFFELNIDYIISLVTSLERYMASPTLEITVSIVKPSQGTSLK